MDRTAMVNRIGIAYNTSNIEGGEYSYVQAAGSSWTSVLNPEMLSS